MFVLLSSFSFQIWLEADIIMLFCDVSFLQFLFYCWEVTHIRFSQSIGLVTERKEQRKQCKELEYQKALKKKTEQYKNKKNNIIGREENKNT